MKILYYITVAYSIFVLTFFILFAGIDAVWEKIAEGFFVRDTMEKMFQREYDSTLLLYNQVVGSFYMGSMILCYLLPFLRIRPTIKYRMSLVALVIMLCVIIIPQIIRWKYGYVFY